MHAARFIYMAQSEFTRPDRKQYNIEFAKQKKREQHSFLGVDLLKYKDAVLNEDEKNSMNYQIGLTPLRKIPISKDPKLVFT